MYRPSIKSLFSVTEVELVIQEQGQAGRQAQANGFFLNIRPAFECLGHEQDRTGGTVHDRPSQPRQFLPWNLQYINRWHFRLPCRSQDRFCDRA